MPPTNGVGRSKSTRWPRAKRSEIHGVGEDGRRGGGGG